LAIEKAKLKSKKEGVEIGFIVNNFFKQKENESDFELIFDRGCFHSFDEKKDRITFARNVSLHLKEGGQWFSIIGNADAGPRDIGPPMRSALDIVSAVEPYFEIVFLV